MVAYASVEQLTDWITPVPVPAGAVRLLDRASGLVDDALLTAVYRVNDAGEPVDQPVIDALREATLEQAAEWIRQGVDGTAAGWDQVSIGRVSLSRSQQTTDPADRLCSTAVRRLRRARLLGQGPLVDWGDQVTFELLDQTRE